MDIYGILAIIGGLVLFLYGITTLGEGLKKVSGGKMEDILQTLTSNKWKGALLGMLVTAVIQSSGATIVMVVGFVNSEIMSLNQAVGVILGANIGTTITAWLLSLTGIQSDNIFLSLLKPANFSPIIGLIGIFMMMFCKKQKQKDVGGILTSFGVLLLGMTAMSEGAAPLADNPEFVGLLTAFSNPILGLLVGLVVTVILQSSSASIGILQSLSLTGVLPMGSAIPVIMGENIGSAITGIIGAIGATRNAIRASLLQLFYCLIKTGVFMVVFYSLNAIIHFPIMQETANPVMIAVFHSVFNIIAVLLMLPASEFLVRLVEKALPVTDKERAVSERKRELQMLDPRFITSTSYAIEQCEKATFRMADYTKEALSTAMGLVLNFNEEGAAKVDQLERTVDDYEDQLNSYLSSISGKTFTAKDSHMFTLLMHCIGDFERISDHALNVMQKAREMDEKGERFSPRAQEELQIFEAALNDIMERTVRAFCEDNTQIAATVEPLEEVIDGLNMEIKRRHVKRLRKGKCTVETGMALEDIITDYERIADHCNNVAVHLSQRTEDGFDTHEYLEHLENNARQDFRTHVSLFEAKYRLPGLEETAPEPETPDARTLSEAKTSPDTELTAAEKLKKKAKEKKEEKKASKKDVKKAKKK